MHRKAAFPTTTDRTRAQDIAKLNTRKSIVGKLVGRVEEVSPGRFAVLVDCDGKPYGAASV
jgi:hypothetical protein